MGCAGRLLGCAQKTGGRGAPKKAEGTGVRPQTKCKCWEGIAEGRSRAGRLGRNRKQNCYAGAASAGRVTRRRSVSVAAYAVALLLALALAAAVLLLLASASVSREGTSTLSITWITVGQPACRWGGVEGCVLREAGRLLLQAGLPGR